MPFVIPKRLARKNQYTITVAPVVDADGTRVPDRFDAMLGEQPLVAGTRQPFLDGARALHALGFAESTVLVMRHAGSDYDALRARLGTAANLEINGKGTGFIKRRAPVGRARHARQSASGHIGVPLDGFNGVHLTIPQRALIGARITTLKSGQTIEKMSKSQAAGIPAACVTICDAAKMMNSTRDSVQVARQIADEMKKISEAGIPASAPVHDADHDCELAS